MTAEERRAALVKFIASALYVGSICRSCTVGVIRPQDEKCRICGAEREMKQ